MTSSKICAAGPTVAHSLFASSISGSASVYSFSAAVDKAGADWSISFAEHVLHLCDIVLVMTVNPGFGGQKFLPEMLPKISDLRRLCETRGLRPWIEVDGGQNGENVREVVAAGADAIVAGSAIFKTPDYAVAISTLRRNAFSEPRP